MEIFKLLSDVKNSDITTNVVKENIYPEINGTLSIKKGIVTYEISWWARLVQVYQMEHLVNAEDIDFEINSRVIEGLEIDDFSKFKQGLLDHGMSSVANSLEITNEEIRNVIIKTITNHKYYTLLFSDCKLYNLLSNEELKLEYVKKIKEDITFLENRDSHIKNRLGWVNENNETLTNQEILNLYN